MRRCSWEYTHAAAVADDILAAAQRGLAVVFFSGVFQVTPSTPGVRLPVFSVTRLTARALPLNEWVSKRCKAFTLPHLPS